MVLSTPFPARRSGRSALRPLVVGTICLLAGLGAAVAPAIAAGPISLVPHEATYDLRLISRSGGSPVVNARGTMTYRMADTCDGWAMESRTRLDLHYTRGEPVETDWSFISWESKDASQYRFRVRSERNGSLEEVIDGRARLPEDDGSGTATYTEPNPAEMTLGPEVLLPAEHTRLLLAAARDGQRLFSAPMFDGSETDGPMLTTAVMTEEVPAGTAAELADHPLLAGRSWRMAISFFTPTSAESLPDYEVRLRYHDNGVAEEVIQDYGTMALRATLTSLKALDPDGC